MRFFLEKAPKGHRGKFLDTVKYEILDQVRPHDIHSAFIRRVLIDAKFKLKFVFFNHFVEQRVLAEFCVTGLIIYVRRISKFDRKNSQ